MTGGKSFTGRARRRTTPASARVAERAARALISIGGIGTILAVVLILAFLVWVVAPLFLGARLGEPARHAIASASQPAASRPLALLADEYRVLAAVLDEDGGLRAYDLATGALVGSRRVSEGAAPSCVSPISSPGSLAALGFADGSVRLARIAFRAGPPVASVTGDAQGALATTAALSEGLVRRHEVELVLEEAVALGPGRAVHRIDVSERGRTSFLCALDEAGNLALLEVSHTENLITGEVELETARSELPFATGSELPEHLMLSGGGDLLYLAWRDGRLVRYDLRDPATARVVEEVDLVDGDGELSALRFLVGKNTLVAADTRGRVQAWFPVKPHGARTSDGIELALAHRLCEEGPPITSLAASARSRLVAAGDAAGGVRLWHVTSGKPLGSALAGDGAEPVQALAFAPKEDGLVAQTASVLASFALDARHPEVGLAALFRPVWYEGYPEPQHVWQSSSGTDDFEPKFGLWPLVFGTLKATSYSMLFAVPIALLAAIFTSQFLPPSLRTPIKSTVELMAGLPSVVLGFLAALVVAPFAQDVVPATLAAVFCVPWTLLAAAHLWQLLPTRLTTVLDGLPRLAVMLASVLGGIVLASFAGPVVESVLFAGDLRAWLDGRIGSATGGWVLLLLPACAAAVGLGVARILGPRLQRASATWDRARCARAALVVFVAGSALSLLLAWVAGATLEGLWLDPRGGVLDTYEQRNALVVGFVMGFAVVPLVYTLSEDALSSVPAHLRLASLGAGATPWQTTWRVVVPAAASGLFSAVMIGLGRAVGETMIVLMAAGNTPVLSWNVFNGFRTLSANIAVELPEAVQGSTHYRTLFLAALLLFLLTFALNTVAELVRQRVRKKAALL